MLVDSAIKGAAILLLAALVTLMLRRDSAATRHLAWLVAIVGMLVVPVFSAILPQWRALPAWAVISTEPVALESPAPAVETTEQPQAALPPNASPVKNEVPTVTGNQPIVEVPVSQPAIVAAEVVPEPTEPRWNRVNALPMLWAIGFFVLVLRLMAARLMLWSKERRGKVIALSQKLRDGRPAEESNDPIVTAFQAACQQLGVRRPVRLLIYSERTIPVVWGIIRFRLLLPAEAGEWSVQQLNSVLLHELAHIRRRDTIAQLLAQIACALHWFNPLVWFAAWRLRVERERACDDLVLARGVRASAYAEHVLNVATRLSSSRWTQACGIAMARNSSLEGRLTAVLSKKRNRRSVTKVFVAVSLILGASIAIPIAMLRAVADTQDGDKEAAVQQDEIPQDGMAQDTTAAVLLKRWQALEERKTPLSEASIARLRAAIDKWVKQPPAKAEAEQVTALRDRNIGRAEHPVAEVAAWLDEIAAIHRGPLEFAINGETRVGAALSMERQASLKFGPAAANGLRAAWSRYPEGDTYVVGDVVYTSLVIQNASEKTIEFTCPYSLDAIVSWNAKAEDGRKIEIQTTMYSGAIPLFTWRLKPGEVAEIGGRSAAIGEGERREQVNNAPTSTVLCVKRGERVTVHWNVREPIAMSTAEISFQVVGVEDVPVWSTLQAGKWRLSGGVTMDVKQELVHATDIASTAILTWPADQAGGTARHEIWLGGDAFANREPWLLVWERGASVLWAMSGQMQSSQEFRKVMPKPRFLRRIDFSDRENITESTWNYLPDIVPNVIRSRFNRTFLPLATAPRTPEHAKPSVLNSRAEDARPVTELLSGTWKSTEGQRDVSITFPEKAADEVKWTINSERKQGSSTINDSLTRLDSPNENAVRLLKPRRQPGNPGSVVLGRLRRGIGDTLLLDIRPDAGFPEYDGATGIVLMRVSAPEAETEPTLLEPKHKSARALFKKWQDNARINGKIPGGALGSLAAAASNFVKHNPTDERAPKLAELLKRIDMSRDWTQEDAVALLDDVTAVYASLPEWAEDLPRFSIAEIIRTGQPLPAELKDAPWGEAQPNGLRAAWLLDPRAEQHHLNTPLKSRILFHNVGKKTVIFRALTWNQSGSHKARDAKDAEIRIVSTSWTTIPQVIPCRLAPGEYTEVIGAGIGVGANVDHEDWRGTRVGAWIEAKEGDEVTFTPAPVSADGRDGRAGVPGESWWLAFIAARLNRDAPLPADAAERKRLLDRAIRDLFGTAPTREEAATFVADRTPDAMGALATRLAQRAGTTPFTGALQSGETKFRVLAVDPEAAKKPRVASGPGRYTLGDNVRLVIVRKPDGDRRVNEANIVYFSSDLPGKPHEVRLPRIELPDGYHTWAIAWERGSTMLWVAEKGVLRSYDFTTATKVNVMRIEPARLAHVPEPLREALRPALEGSSNASTQPAATPAAAGAKALP